MPTYRSITLSLISQYDFQSIPEYHLPSDDPSPPIGISDPNSKIHGDPKEAYSPADDSNHSIGVCAPIFPNSQFWLSFDAVRPAFPTEYYFFKFFVDGKHFNSWGIGEESDWRGKMVFGLFANKYDQIERRNLTFGSGVGLSGMIEVKVFRCFGRKRINAHLNCLTEAKSGRQRPAQKEKRAVKTQYELAGLLKRRDQDMRGVK
ncbi:MAG: hypothetical protein M1840_003521 [Geoglossum simile]|nr:MAG: hypothetical protein M1840_003521 [Geoglossum simile]